MKGEGITHGPAFRGIQLRRLLIFGSLALVLLVAGCVSTTQQSKLIGNKTLIREIVHFQDLSRENGTTVAMLTETREKLEGDHFAEDLIDEAIWLVRFREWEHSEHTLSFLTTYLNDGTELICPGHEIEHIGLFVKHGNFELLNHTMESLEEFYPKWKKTAYERAAKYPAFYRNLDNVTRVIEATLPRIRSGDYNISSEIEFLNRNEVC